jgi:hypothetical protein
MFVRPWQMIWQGGVLATLRHNEADGVLRNGPARLPQLSSSVCANVKFAYLLPGGLMRRLTLT